ncbi:MAG: CDP-diacylglycerol--glycerol-3-phosphate 3-phosphatidyltransferase [Candidatus Omnitrophica bacterium]|nr:CDP-diacylglycerol--glycerol-3-phosphate 3-phosphatidyltransferase [Candidatus Omnitrophota bacterium]MBU4477983.1 CDP-diacylglycerol--glycerol-3-phosphate 3-phosphatidyltransferase [Candidatus Omnitrophota bacterium]MCG2704193.1 CDP-diacylglycerol--glycerol-3-phosphate 3-phosphatidyltransferase [Candidatus Omnitrophota bacterium]
MNLPNRLTVLRIVLSFIFMFLLFSEGVLSKVIALCLFIIACITDFYDGYIARKYNLITDLGKLLDPIADKILVLAAFLAFVEMGIIPAWMVVVIIFRELLITGIRVLSANKGKILAASLAGKHKTVSQMVSIFVILGFIVLKESGTTIFSFWNNSFEFWKEIIIGIFMYITVALTLISGISYMIKNKNVFWNAKSD